jgi:DNA-binding NarL/FixJ family response regulator
MGPKVSQRCRPAKTARGRGNEPAGDGTPRPTTPMSALSNREIEVLRLIGKGLTRNEIADQLSRSAKTIDGHRERIMKKLGLHTTADLMRYAIREGLSEA